MTDIQTERSRKPTSQLEKRGATERQTDGGHRESNTGRERWRELEVEMVDLGETKRETERDRDRETD